MWGPLVFTTTAYCLLYSALLSFALCCCICLTLIYSTLLSRMHTLLCYVLLFFTTHRPCFTLPYSYLPYFSLTHSHSLLFSALLVFTNLLHCCSYETGVQKMRRNSLTFVLRRIRYNARLLVPNYNQKRKKGKLLLTARALSLFLWFRAPSISSVKQQ